MTEDFYSARFRGRTVCEPQIKALEKIGERGQGIMRTTPFSSTVSFLNDYQLEEFSHRRPQVSNELLRFLSSSASC